MQDSALIYRDDIVQSRKVAGCFETSTAIFKPVGKDFAYRILPLVFIHQSQSPRELLRHKTLTHVISKTKKNFSPSRRQDGTNCHNYRPSTQQ